MDNSNEKLTKKEYLELIVEGGIGAIPYKTRSVSNASRNSTKI